MPSQNALPAAHSRWQQTVHLPPVAQRRGFAYDMATPFFGKSVTRHAAPALAILLKRSRIVNTGIFFFDVLFAVCGGYGTFPASRGWRDASIIMGTLFQLARRFPCSL